MVGASGAAAVIATDLNHEPATGHVESLLLRHSSLACRLVDSVPSSAS